MSTDTENPHPLVAWLADQGTNIFAWGPEQGLPKTTLYHMVHGREPSVRTLLSIEEKTAGAVSMRQCIDWWQAHQLQEQT